MNDIFWSKKVKLVTISDINKEVISEELVPVPLVTLFSARQIYDVIRSKVLILFYF